MRFEFEARAASRLNHPNILTVHDIGEDGGSLFLIAELIDGESLREVLRGRPLSLSQVLHISSQIADGLGAAHEAGITHRDLKPENVLLTRDARAKIVDFGLAKPSNTAATQLADAETLSVVATTPGVLLGTVGHMSPEQARGDPIDDRSDQFSFGCILYEMVAGRGPFDRSDAVSTMAAILRDEPPPLAASYNVPPPFRWIVERCLAKDPSRRFAATADLYRQLCDVRDHLGELGSAFGVGRQRSSKFSRRWAIRLLVGAAALVVGLLLTLARLRTDDSESTYRIRAVCYRSN